MPGIILVRSMCVISIFSQHHCKVFTSIAHLLITLYINCHVSVHLKILGGSQCFPHFIGENLAASLKRA